MKVETIVDFCQRWIVIFYYLLILTLPHSTALFESFASATLVLFFIKRGALFVQLIKKDASFSSYHLFYKIQIFLKSFKPVESYLNWPIGLFIFINFLSVIFSRDPILSIQGFFFKILQITYVYFIFIESIVTKKQIKTVIVLCVFSAAFIGFNGLIQYVFGVAPIAARKILPDGRITSSFKHANGLGAYLIVLIMMLIGILFSKKKGDINSEGKMTLGLSYPIYKWGYLVLFSILIVCFGLTYSRGAWVGLLIAFVFFGCCKRESIPVLLILTLSFGFIFYPKMLSLRNVSFISDNARGEKGLRLGKVNVVEKVNTQKLKPKHRDYGMGRPSFWKEALAIIRDYPIVGCGLNTYSKVAPKYKITWQGGGYPHNSYLHMAAETGLLGLAMFLYILFVIFKEFFKRYPLINDPFFYNFHIGIFAGFVGYLTHSFVDTIFYSVQLSSFLWIIMALIVSIQKV